MSDQNATINEYSASTKQERGERHNAGYRRDEGRRDTLSTARSGGTRRRSTCRRPTAAAVAAGRAGRRVGRVARCAERRKWNTRDRGPLRGAVVRSLLVRQEAELLLRGAELHERGHAREVLRAGVLDGGTRELLRRVGLDVDDVGRRAIVWDQSEFLLDVCHSGLEEGRGLAVRLREVGRVGLRGRLEEREVDDEDICISSGEAWHTDEVDVVLREGHCRLVRREVAPSGRRADVGPGNRARVCGGFRFHVKEEHLASRECI